MNYKSLAASTRLQKITPVVNKLKEVQNITAITDINSNQHHRRRSGGGGNSGSTMPNNQEKSPS